MASRTKDKILLASRLLFNEEGVSNVGMVDIAATLDISPGNLYYHYRGKEQLIPVIFEQFSIELSALLSADSSELVSLEDRWAYQYLILETLYNFRFLHGLDSVRFDKSLSKGYKRLRILLMKEISQLIDQLQRFGLQSDDLLTTDIAFLDSFDKEVLAENITLFMFSWSSYIEADQDDKETRKFLHDGVYRIFYQLSALCTNNSELLHGCKKLMFSSSSS